jgi:predicted MFS family arabinose efflux permease
MIQNNRTALKILFISNGIFVFADRLLGPLYAIYAEKFHTSTLWVSFSWFVYVFSATIFTAIVAKYGDKVKEKEYLLVAGFMFRVLSWILYIFTSNIELFLFVQVMLGLGDAMGSPAFDSIFATHIDKGSEVNEYSTWKLVLSFSMAIASLLGGLIVYYYSFELLFVIMALLGVVSSLVVLLQPRKLL